jgi:hypothetical protein
MTEFSEVHIQHPAWHRPYLLNISRHPYQGFSSSHLDTIAEKSDLASPGLIERGAGAPKAHPGTVDDYFPAKVARNEDHLPSTRPAEDG